MHPTRLFAPLLIILALFGLGTATLAAAPTTPTAEHTVCPADCDYATVSAALAAATAGDTIIVAPGIYTETITLKAGVRLQGTPLLTELNGNGSGPVVTAADPAILTDTVMSGFVIRNGTADRGAGIYIDNGAAPTLSALLVVDNRAAGANAQGGGLYASGSGAPVIRLTSFMSNTADSGAGVYINEAPAVLTGNTFQFNRAADHGGAIHLAAAAAHLRDNLLLLNTAGGQGAGAYASGGMPQFEQNIIAGNAAQNQGGGLAFDGGTPHIRHNRLISNVSVLNGGGGMVATAADLTVFNNLIVANRSTGFGAGLLLNDSDGTIANNTLAQNRGFSAATGAAVYLNGAGRTPTVQNNIIVRNTYGVRGPLTANAATPTLTHNNVWQNVQGDYVGANIANQADNAGNLSRDPLFVSGLLGDFYLSHTAAGQAADSPAVDAGTDTAAALGLDTRTTRTDDQPDANTVDMGYHFPSATYLRTQLPVDGGTFTLTHEITAMLDFPTPTVTRPLTLTAAFTRSLPVPDGTRSVGRPFDIEVHAADGEPVTAFNPPFTLTVTYPDEAVGNRFVTEHTLQLHTYNPSTRQWETVPNQTHDPATNRVSAPIDHLTTFALLGQTMPDSPHAATLFRRNRAGWRVVGDAQQFGALPPRYRRLGGNPRGHLVAHDDVTGGTWFWAAPDAFLGDAAAVYGTYLRFDLYHRSERENQYDDSDVILVGGPLTDTVTLVYDTPINPRPRWTVYHLPLRPAPGWQRLVAGASCAEGVCIPATADDFHHVLSNLRRLHIRGEFESGPDTGGLDNVIFGTTTLTTPVTAEDGGLLTFMDDIHLQADFPAGLVTGTVTATVGVSLTAPPPPAGQATVGRAVDITLRDAAGTAQTQFDRPFTLTVTYGANAPIVTDTVGLHFWDETAEAWTPIAGTHNPAARTITAEVDHLTTFALLAEPQHRVFLPAVRMSNEQ